MIARLFFWITGGRPMIDEGFAFRDVVTGDSVRYFRDRLGRRWLALGKWDAFRVARSTEPSTRIRDMKTWTFRRDR